MRLLLILLGIAIVWTATGHITFGFPFFSKHKNPVAQFKLDKPRYVFQPYNNPPGTQELNLFYLEIKKYVLSVGVVSPNMARMAYSEVYFYPQNKQTTSKLFYVDLGHMTTISDQEAKKILDIKSPDVFSKELLAVGQENMESDLFETLTVVDWSHDSRKILIKETRGERERGIKKTILWVYDFNKEKMQKITAIRKAIANFWKTRMNLVLSDYTWDIVPLGWDLNEPDRIVVNAYVYASGNSKQFLGAWSIDSEGRRTQLLSLDNWRWPVSKNGRILVEEKK